MWTSQETIDKCHEAAWKKKKDRRNGSVVRFESVTMIHSVFYI